MKREYSERERYLLWLGFVLGPGSKRYFRALTAFENDAHAMFTAAQKHDLPPECGLKEPILEKLFASATQRYIDGCFKRLAELDVSAAAFESPEYPALLKEIYDPPPILYYRGRLQAEPALPIAVVGSRSPTEYGRRMAHTLSQALAECGACVVSGLAYGVDCIAALGALAAEDNPYPTIAVLGSGVDVVYPAANRDIYEQIIARGAVVSEFLPGTKALPSNFPMRNRIISGLSRGVPVVEAAAKSGTLITVDCALEQGRDVFALPGRITDPKSEGTNVLLREGHAKFTLSAEDVLEEYGGWRAVKAQTLSEPENLSLEQAVIRRLLLANERSFDELCELTGFSVPLLNSTLTEMEFSGIIRQSPGRVYSIECVL